MDRRQMRLGTPDANVALLNDFNPAKPKGESLVDPWYGDQAGFEETLEDVEAAMPGILDAVTERGSAA